MGRSARPGRAGGAGCPRCAGVHPRVREAGGRASRPDGPSKSRSRGSLAPKRVAKGVSEDMSRRMCLGGCGGVGSVGSSWGHRPPPTPRSGRAGRRRRGIRLTRAVRGGVRPRTGGRSCGAAVVPLSTCAHLRGCLPPHPGAGSLRSGGRAHSEWTTVSYARWEKRRTQSGACSVERMALLFRRRVRVHVQTPLTQCTAARPSHAPSHERTTHATTPHPTFHSLAAVSPHPAARGACTHNTQCSPHFRHRHSAACGIRHPPRPLAPLPVPLAVFACRHRGRRPRPVRCV